MGYKTRPFGRGEGNASNATSTFRRHGIPAITCGPNVRTEINGAEINKLNGRHVAKVDIAEAARFTCTWLESLAVLRAQLRKNP